jgi:hypothetical protein
MNYDEQEGVTLTQPKYKSKQIIPVMHKAPPYMKEMVSPIVGLADIPYKRNEMDKWSVNHLAKYKNDELDARKEAIKETKYKIGEAAFKKRMKRNLDKKEYIRQMKLLNMLSPSDDEKEEEDLPWEITMYREFSETRK